ncbi:MAG: hypothetical protein HYV54_01705 [Parcubacteria group bacterium]|nr:hypothetical protein [Parcubacteria group bacterium]
MEHIFSKKWLWVGLVIAVVNPVFSGLILGSLYLTEPGLKKYGRIILSLAIVWGAASFWLVRKFAPLLPTL